jgi:murein DD-endopeptidase MepM/ murein hydrolase activator NlpD
MNRPSLPSCWKAFCLLFLAYCAPLAFAAKPSKSTTLTWQPAKLVRGSPVLFRVSAAAKVNAVSASWMGHNISFFRSSTANTWYGFGGIPVETPNGSYPLVLTETVDGRAVQVSKKVKITSANYPRFPAHVAVAKQFTEPTPEQLKQIAADKSIKAEVFSTLNPVRLWKTDFSPPVTARISDVFGVERVFNGQVQSRHLGLDYAVPSGTPVHAINSGKVILARSLYFEGGFVVIDHGQGLMSLYLHLSKLQVNEGDAVEAGQLIGLSGGSGRATGPHLHLAIRWQGVYLSPAVLLSLKFPG